ncbi:MAG: VWA domain-containing protein [Spirochaetales bacterium]|nr:VWA domain-containing protein [Spirochaetales bacterium]
MVRKLSLYYIIFLLACVFSLYGTENELVLMVDTSASMEPVFDEMTAYLNQVFFDEWLPRGTKLHLLRFSDFPVHETTRYIDDAAERVRFEKEILLLSGKLVFGRYTDLVTATRELLRFGESLPEQHVKVLALITDGIHDPPPGSWSSSIDPELFEKRLDASATGVIRRSGYSIYFFRVHGSEGGNTAGYGTIREVADNMNIPLDHDDTVDYGNNPYDVIRYSRIEFPGDLGEQGRIFSVPFIIENPNEEEIVVSLLALSHEGTNILTGTVSPRTVAAGTRQPFDVTIMLSPETEIGQHHLPVRLVFGEGTHIRPGKGILTFYYKGDIISSMYQLVSGAIPVIFFLLFISVFIISIILTLRKKNVDNMFGTVMKPVKWKERLLTINKNGLPLIEMRVSFQNPHVGFRNIHKIKKNRRMSVGGGFSNFLIFLVPIPSHIAEIYKENGTYVFNPIKNEYFPDTDGPVVDCLDKDIVMVSPHGYQSKITFNRYVSPLTRLNELLNSIYGEKRQPAASRQER